MLVTARLIGGIGIGMLSMVAPLYISEISPPEIRGSLLVLEELSIVTGIVVRTSPAHYSLFRQIGSLETLSRDSRASLYKVVLTR